MPSGGVLYPHMWVTSVSARKYFSFVLNDRRSGHKAEFVAQAPA